MLTELGVKGWRCLRNVTVALTPLHAFIGPNDSGKSTLLTALAMANGPNASARFRIRTARLELQSSPQEPHFVGVLDGVPFTNWPAVAEQVRQEIGTARYLRLEPDHLRVPSPLLPGDEISLDARGGQLAGVYDAILNRDREAWDTIESSVRDGFPTVKRLALRNVGTTAKVMEVELLDGTRVPAEQMSEGLLYWLAFACLPSVSPTKLLLVEEPENGLHPSRIRDVVGVLRRVVAAGTQVVLATHSPLVVNELEPEEVSIVTRTAEAGTRVRRVSEIPDLDRLRSVFSLGEMWLAFADGKEEAALFEPHRSSA